MTEAKREVTIRRILVALDASSHSLAALETATWLASRLKAELIGLFVEDIDLLRVAEFPFTRQVGLFSSTFQRLDLLELERQLRAQANQIRQALTAIAERAQVPWRFRVARGSVSSEVLAAGAKADLTIVGKRGRSLSLGKRVGSTARMVMFEGQGLTLVLQQREELTAPVMVVYDSSPAAENALEAALNLANAINGHLSVLVIADDEHSLQKAQADVAERLKRKKQTADVHLLMKPTVSGLTYVLKGKGLLVLPCSEGLLQGEKLCELVNVVRNPVLLVRGEHPLKLWF